MLLEDLKNILISHGMYYVTLSPLSSEDISHWASMPLWNTFNAILLSFNMCPGASSTNEPQDFDPILNKKILRRQEVLDISIRAKTLPLVTMRDYNGYNIDVPEEEISNICMVKPDDFIKWADGIGWTLPEELSKAVARVHGDIDLNNNGTSCRYNNEGLEEPMVKEELSSKENQAGKYNYRFEKTDKAWNVQFGDAAIPGVKDLLGLSYIKILLKNPGEKISVIKLQALVGSDGPDSENEEYDAADDIEVSGSNISAWEGSDVQSIREYNCRLGQIEEELKLKTTGNVHNRSKIESLKIEKSAIEAHLKEASYRPKDPEIEKNRKRVLKNISDAIASIRKLEDLHSYNDKPISSHLNRYIKTGTSCSYTAEKENLPDWKF